MDRPVDRDNLLKYLRYRIEDLQDMQREYGHSNLVHGRLLELLDLQKDLKEGAYAPHAT